MYMTNAKRMKDSKKITLKIREKGPRANHQPAIM